MGAEYCTYVNGHHIVFIVNITSGKKIYTLCRQNRNRPQEIRGAYKIYKHDDILYERRYTYYTFCGGEATLSCRLSLVSPPPGRLSSFWRWCTGVTPNWLRNPILFTTDKGGGIWYVGTQRWERTSRWCACVWGWLLHGEWERRYALVYVLCVERESEYIYTRDIEKRRRAQVGATRRRRAGSTLYVCI